MLRFVMLLSGLLLLLGCQTPATMQQLQNKNQTLQVKLKRANQQISKLQTDKQKLRTDLDEAQRVIDVMSEEKSARVKEATTLRAEVRQFIQRQIDSLKAFLLNSNLLDYVGGELVRRKKYDNRPIMLVDLENRIPRAGVLTGVGGYFVKPTQLVVKVLRPVNNKLIVIWESRPIAVNRTGLVKIGFPVTIGVEKGDVLGYYFPKVATVSFDTGTADTRYLNKNLRPGTRFSISSLDGEDERRAYSLGVYGLLK